MHRFVYGGVETKLGSLFFPRFAIISIAVLSLLLTCFAVLEITNKFSLGVILKKEKSPVSQQTSAEEHSWKKAFLYIVMLFGYLLLLYSLGFLVSSPLMIFSVMLLFGGRRLKLMIPLSIIVPLLIYYGCYHYMKVFLPVGVLFD